MLAELRRRFPAAGAICGTAENIPLADSTVDAVVVGQAFHWFDPDRALSEMAACCVPGARWRCCGTTTTNPTRSSQEIYAAMTDAGRPPGGATRRSGGGDDCRAAKPTPPIPPFHGHPALTDPRVVRIGWQRRQSVDDLIGLVNTYSYVIRAIRRDPGHAGRCHPDDWRHRHAPRPQDLLIPVELSGLAVDMPVTSTEHTVLTRSQWRERSRRMPNRVRRADPGASGAGQRPDTAPGRGFPVHLLLAAPGASSGAGTRAPGSHWPMRADGLDWRFHRESCDRTPSGAARPGRWSRSTWRRSGRPVGPDSTFTGRLLRATAAAPAQFGCFGLHEWAMVLPARTTSAAASGLAAAARARTAPTRSCEEHQIKCTHYDAFRFFTPPARPAQSAAAGPGSPAGPGAARLPARVHGPVQVGLQADPAVPSELLVDCFVLARRDPRAGHAGIALRPADLGYPPVRIETVAGKAEYVAAQREFAAQAQVLRRRAVRRRHRGSLTVTGPRSAIETRCPAAVLQEQCAADHDHRADQTDDPR